MDEQTYTLKIQHVLVESPRVKLFRLGSEQGKLPFGFLPGQHMGVRPHGVKEDKKNQAEARWCHFSLASSPQERDFLEIAVLKQGEASERMHRLSAGTCVQVTRPEGSFVLQEPLGYGPVLFAAGIGAAPVRSMVKYCLDKKLAESITLFLCYSKPDESIFMEEFQQWAQQNPHFSLWTHFTRAKPSCPGGSTGHKKFWRWSQLQDRIENPLERTYFVCVPTGLREKVKTEIESMGVANEQIRKEIW